MMGLKMQVEIQESQEELEKALKYATHGSSKERLRMFYWLKKEPRTYNSLQLAQKIQNDRQDLIYRTGDLGKWLSR